MDARILCLDLFMMVFAIENVRVRRTSDARFRLISIVGGRFTKWNGGHINFNAVYQSNLLLECLDGSHEPAINMSCVANNLAREPCALSEFKIC